VLPGSVAASRSIIARLADSAPAPPRVVRFWPRTFAELAHAESEVTLPFDIAAISGGKRFDDS
jgi:hypothetical protein